MSQWNRLVSRVRFRDQAIRRGVVDIHFERVEHAINRLAVARAEENIRKLRQRALEKLSEIFVTF